MDDNISENIANTFLNTVSTKSRYDEIIRAEDGECQKVCFSVKKTDDMGCSNLSCSRCPINAMSNVSVDDAIKWAEGITGRVWALRPKPVLIVEIQTVNAKAAWRLA